MKTINWKHFGLIGLSSFGFFVLGAGGYVFLQTWYDEVQTVVQNRANELIQAPKTELAIGNRNYAGVSKKETGAEDEKNAFCQQYLALCQAEEK